MTLLRSAKCLILGTSTTLARPRASRLPSEIVIMIFLKFLKFSASRASLSMCQRVAVAPFSIQIIVSSLPYHEIQSKKNTTSLLKMNKALFLLLQIITCSLPLVGTGLFTYILIATTGDTPITDWSVSDAFAAYPDYQKLLIVLIFAASLIFATTAIRNIQVRIWFRRRYGNYLTSCCRKQQQPSDRSTGQLSQGSAKYLAFMNDFASFVNIVAYIFFILLAVFPSGTGTASIQQVHNTSTVVYFTLALLYAILQTLLTCKQQHYPKYVSIIQIIVVLIRGWTEPSVLVYVFLYGNAPVHHRVACRHFQSSLCGLFHRLVLLRFSRR